MWYFPSFSTETWTLVAILFAIFMWYGYAPYGFFKKLGIQGPKPLPFIGTFLEYKRGLFIFDNACYQKYGDVWGLFDGRLPIMGVMDTAMIKTILVKECYSVFTNRRDFGLNGELHDAVTTVEDDEWKRIRSTLSPSFTSGRLKDMFMIMTQHSRNLVKFLQKKVDTDEVLEVKEIFGAYSMDVVASSAFSVDIDSINQPNDPLVVNVKKLLKFNLLNPLLILVVLFPFMRPLLEMCNVSFLPAGAMKFFYSFLRKIKAERSKNVHNTRVDLMQLMVDSQIPQDHRSKEAAHKGLTDHEILSQALTYIFGGYETSSSTLGFLSYNLATNPDVQAALQDEIDQIFPDKAPPTYEGLMQMEYLDMVINETLRVYPIISRLERVAKATVEVNGVTIPKGTVVMIPIMVLHHHPTHWPKPEVFRPERFSKGNRENIDPYTFLTFGMGPRNCIGMRFALQTIKLVTVEILQRFSFVTCKETEVPLELFDNGFIAPTKPIKLKLVPRVVAHSQD
ncbi:cytochrome P450 3A30 [Oncorhynchus kisutch]|uniref:Cytochrome P450 3A n=1 Tax=Oncorhynchus kisutch TaxID=8019 RepID=A0A8C7G2C7_ONCKI|nr:cytochrome P450 3A30-like [Oncorhynchus kisutch]